VRNDEEGESQHLLPDLIGDIEQGILVLVIDPQVASVGSKGGCSIWVELSGVAKSVSCTRELRAFRARTAAGPDGVGAGHAS